MERYKVVDPEVFEKGNLEQRTWLKDTSTWKSGKEGNSGKEITE